MTRVIRSEALSPAERLLQELGVTEARDIDLEAIAHYRGVAINYRPLEGCEAQIIGLGDRAVAIVNARSGRRRRRFSLAHELGHWHYHRGRVLTCRLEGERDPSHGPTHPERVADDFAADLLLPRYLFRPAAIASGKATVEVAEHLSDTFDTSLTATLIRLVEFGPDPALVVCHTEAGRKWFTRGPDVPERWFPRQDLDPDSYAMEVLFGDPQRSRRVRIGADAWFERREAERFEIVEQTVQVSDSEVLSLLIFSDDEMLEDLP